MPANVRECHLGGSFEIWTIIFFSSTVSTLCWGLHKPLEETVLFSWIIMIQCVPVNSEKDSLLQLSRAQWESKGFENHEFSLFPFLVTLPERCQFSDPIIKGLLWFPLARGACDSQSDLQQGFYDTPVLFSSFWSEMEKPLLPFAMFLLVCQDCVWPFTLFKPNKISSFELCTQLSFLIYSRLYFGFHKVCPSLKSLARCSSWVLIGMLQENTAVYYTLYGWCIIPEVIVEKFL